MSDKSVHHYLSVQLDLTGQMASTIETPFRTRITALLELSEAESPADKFEQ